MIATPWKSFTPVDGDDGGELKGLRLKPGPITDYIGRNGYDPNFIPGVELALPGLGENTPDATPLHDEALFEDGADPHELKYQNFSVKMCRSRRQPFYSAVNIDGRQSARGAGWCIRPAAWT